jgi:hypothetical protein
MRPFDIWQPQPLADYFAAAGLGVVIEAVDTVPSAQTPVRSRVVMTYTDPDGTPHELRLMFYGSTVDAFTDQARLSEIGWQWIVQRENVVLITRSLQDIFWRPLVDAWDSVSDINQITQYIAGATATADAAIAAEQAEFANQTATAAAPTPDAAASAEAAPSS